MSKSTWFEDLPVIGRMPAQRAANKLLEVGEDKAAAEVLTRAGAKGTAFGPLDWLKRPWASPTHTFGHVSAGELKPNQNVDVQNVSALTPDPSLKDTPLTISLGCLAIADYPGGGNHKVLFDFSAKHQVGSAAEDLHYNLVVRGAEGQRAAVVNYPIFVGLRVGGEGAAFRCYTVNVTNDADEALLGFLDSDAFRAGLHLVEVAQPAIVPLSQMAYGLTRALAQRNRNVPVQDFQLGLDFAAKPFGACLREGAYIAVQVPSEFVDTWDWAQWVYRTSAGDIVSRADSNARVPYNHVVFTVSR
jgi:hypothetical protein